MGVWFSNRGQIIQVVGVPITILIASAAVFYQLPVWLGWRALPTSIYVSCESQPSIFPVNGDGRVYLLGLFNVPAETQPGLMRISQEPNTSYRLSDAPYGYRCAVFNYGSEPITNVRFAVRVAFRPQCEREKKDYWECPPSRERPFDIYIAKIDPGAASPFTFFVANRTKEWVDATIEESAKIQRLGTRETLSLPLVSTLDANRLLFHPTRTEP